MSRAIDKAFAPVSWTANRVGRSVGRFLLGGMAIAAITLLGSPFKNYRGAVALVYLMIVAVVSLTGDLFSSSAVAVMAAGCLRYFFAPPPATVRIDEPLDIAALVTYLATAVVITHLISKMQQLTQELQRREAHLAEAQKLAHSGSWVWRLKGREAVYLSEEWYRIYGFDPADGLPTWEQRLERVHPEDRVKWQEILDRATAEKTDYEVEFRIVAADGTVRHLHTVGHPILSQSGDLIQFVGSSTDITERKRAEEALREAQGDLARVSRVTTMGELTAALAHEVNQPIAAAVTNANTCLRWLTREQPDVNEARLAADRIVKDGTRAAEIIKRVRLLFQKGAAEREPVQINEVIQEMTTLLRGEAARHKILIEMELAADLPEVRGDRLQLQQVLMNLMMNGIDAMKEVEGARVLAVKTQRGENEEVMVAVRDTGVGLPSEAAEQIFNAFFTTKPHGTGMGLRISRSIIESHGGRLWAGDSTPRGASFSFTIPTGRATRA